MSDQNSLPGNNQQNQNQNEQVVVPAINVRIPPAPVINTQKATSPAMSVQMETLWIVGRPNAISNFSWPTRQALDEILKMNKKIKLAGLSFKHTSAIEHLQLEFTEGMQSTVACSDQSKNQLMEKRVVIDPTKTIRKIEFAVSGE